MRDENSTEIANTRIRSQLDMKESVYVSTSRLYMCLLALAVILN